MAIPHDPSQSLIAEAQALIERVQHELATSQDELSRLGIDTAQLEARMTDADREQARLAIEADMQAVEQEVREELARRSFSAPSGSSTRRRSMI